LGCPLPVRSRRSRVQPIRCSFLRPYPRILLHGRSSPGVRPSYTVCPAISALDLSAGGTSPGVFLPLQRSRRRESTSRSRSGPRAPWWCQGVRRRVPTRRLRCRSQVFSTSQQLVLPSALPPFSDGWRSWGSPFRDLVLPRSPGGSSPSACPRDVHRLQGLRPRENRSCPRVTVSSPRTNLSLLVFLLLMV